MKLQNFAYTTSNESNYSNLSNKRHLRTVPGNQEFIILSKSRLARIFNRGEDVLSSNGEYVHVETPSDGSTATGPAVRHRHFLVSLSSDLVASQVSLEDGTAFGGVLGFLSPGCTVLIGGY